MHFIASSDKNCADERELINMVNELLGIQYNIAKANRTDRKIQNLASYINEDTLKAIHKTMDKRKAYGIDKVTKEGYERNLEESGESCKADEKRKLPSKSNKTSLYSERNERQNETTGNLLL